jgi:hypothetical protein
MSHELVRCEVSHAPLYESVGMNRKTAVCSDQAQ